MVRNIPDMLGSSRLGRVAFIREGFASERSSLGFLRAVPLLLLGMVLDGVRDLDVRSQGDFTYSMKTSFVDKTQVSL